MVAPAGGTPVAGVCFARAGNAKLPPYWLVYVAVENLDASMERCRSLGGTVVDGPRQVGAQRYCVVQDPAGAYVGLIGA
jgi:predicted enzyme related to lactoylglutathione lyase